MSNITKKHLCSTISASTGLSHVDTQLVVESFLTAIQSAILNGNNIELRGFGRFKIKPRKARKARNPITGEAVQVPAGLKLVFQASRELRKRVNEKNKDALSNILIP